MITCNCGYVAQGATEDDKVADARRHAREEHGIDVTQAQVLAAAGGEVA